MLMLLLVQVGVLVRDQVLVIHAAREGARAAAVTGANADAAEKAALAAAGLPLKSTDVLTTPPGTKHDLVRVQVHVHRLDRCAAHRPIARRRARDGGRLDADRAVMNAPADQASTARSKRDRARLVEGLVAVAALGCCTHDGQPARHGHALDHLERRREVPSAAP